MQLTKHIFRAYDIRGEVPSELNPEVMYQIGRALATLASKHGYKNWHLGWDGRISSPELAQAMGDGLTASGASVVQVGLVPTPLVYYATMRSPDMCGVMITGSHNPAQFNGCKITIGGKSLANEDIQAIYHCIINKEYISAEGNTTKVDVSRAYIEDAISNSTLKRKLRLVIDAGNGAAGELAPQLFRELGCEVIEHCCEIDGTFPNHHPDPGKLENLKDLQQLVIQHQADIGFAFDGDGDRLGIITEQSQVVFPDIALMLFAQDMLSRCPGAKVLADVKCSPLVLKTIRELGGQASLAPTGHSLIKIAMREQGALLAGEMSGHIYFAENWNGCDDALLAGVRLLKILDRSEQSASQLFQQFPSWHGTAEINITTSENRKWEVLQLLREQGNFAEGNIITLDGIRVEYDQSWGLVRCSNTTPTLVLRFEGATQDKLAATIEHFTNELSRLAPELDMTPLHQALTCASTKP